MLGLACSDNAIVTYSRMHIGNITSLMRCTLHLAGTKPVGLRPITARGGCKGGRDLPPRRLCVLLCVNVTVRRQESDGRPSDTENC